MTKFEETDIRRGKELLENISNNQYLLGELADGIETKYGEGTLEEFAEAIGIDYSTLKGYRYVWRKWKNSPTKPRNYSLAKALASYKHKEAYAEGWPNKTERQAREDVKRLKKEEREENGETKGRPFRSAEKLKGTIMKAVEAFLSEDSKERRALNMLASAHTSKIAWKDYSDMWDALDAAKGRVIEQRDRLGEIYRPDPEAAPEAAETSAEAGTTEEPEAAPEAAETSAEPEAAPEQRRSQRQRRERRSQRRRPEAAETSAEDMGQVMKIIPFRKGESESED